MSAYVDRNRAMSTTLAVAWPATIAACAGAIYALHQLGNVDGFDVAWSHLWGWLGTHGPEVVLMALGRVAGLVLSYWIAGSLLVYTAARATGIHPLIRSVEWMTLPPIRRLAERSVALALSLTTLTAGVVGPAVASHPTPDDDAPPAVAWVYAAGGAGSAEYVPIPADDDVNVTDDALPAPDETAAAIDNSEANREAASLTDISYVPIPAGTERGFPLAPTAHFDAAAPRLFDPAAADRMAGLVARFADQAYEHSVVTGDSLWTIAEGHLGAVLDRAPSEAEIATYWSHLIDANRSRLRSGDPDLIFPGEVVVCPPATDVGIGG